MCVAFLAYYCSADQVIGSGTYLDSVRLRVHIGAALGICPSSVDAYVVGEHGDSQVALCSAVQVSVLHAPPDTRPFAADAALQCARAVCSIIIMALQSASSQVGGSRLMGVKDGSVAAAASETAGGFPSRLLQAPAVRAKFSSAVARRGPDIVALKGATSHGVGAAVAHMCDCILRDKQEVLPASVYVDQLRACVVWPAVLGRSGAGRLMDLELSPEEEEALRKSVSIVSAAVEPYTKPPFV